MGRKRHTATGASRGRNVDRTCGTGYCGAMLTAFTRAIGQLDDPRVVRVLGASVLASAAVFVALWIGTGWLLTSSALVDTGWIDAALDVLGGLATLALTWVLFPSVVSGLIGLFLERIAAAVEARHYPELPKAPGLPFVAGVLATVRFLALVVALNVLLLALLAFPPAYPVAWFAANGWLLGREYFEFIALRRLAPAEARALRRRHGGELLLMGVVTAGMLAVPLLNLIAPVLATAAMVHRFEAWRRTA
jgi:uncharacterized protein involved in cysteine biosynthesis